MRVFLSIIIAFTISLAVSRTHATTIRYAIVLGNDVGVDENGTQPFPPLRHAEREAAKLRNQLVSLSNFDDSHSRTKLLTGATRTEVRKAVAQLAKQKQLDEKNLGAFNSLFLLYYTGHGLEGRLLLQDGPLYATEIGTLFKTIGADFAVGVFDACYAGSLDKDALNAKGMDPAPGLNLFRELPEEVLTAEGNIWYVSSGPKQQSFEDAKLGGVFTHFFIEGMKKAQPSGPGITLESIWQYARSHTVNYTTKRRRTQVPERYIAKLRSSAPVYFSFPIERDATLVLSSAVEGRFLLSYVNGHLTEVFEKKKGETRRYAVFPGKAELKMYGSQKQVIKRPVHLSSGSTLVLSAFDENPPEVAIGEQSHPLFSKGLETRTTIRATRINPGSSLLAGVAYGFNASNKLLLHARHGFTIPFRLDFPSLVFTATVIYGYDKRHFPAFDYQVHQAGAKATVGYGIDFKPTRLSMGAGTAFRYMWQQYGDDTKRTGWQIHPIVEIAALLPRKGRICGEVFANIGPLYTPGIGRNADHLWHVSGSVGMALFLRINE